MVRVKSVLERASSTTGTVASSTSRLILLDGSVAAVVRGACVVKIHQAVRLVIVLLAAPDSPSDKAHDTKDDKTADSYNNANDSVASLS